MPNRIADSRIAPKAEALESASPISVVEKIQARIAALEAGLIRSMYATDIKDALAIMEKMKHEPHVHRVAGDDKRELDFLRTRKTMLEKA